MLEIVGAVALSHAPMWDLAVPAPGPGHRFAADVLALRAKVDALAPDAVVIFGPDHFRNFFYDVMPAFCIGVEGLTGFGDFGRHAGAIPAATALGKALHHAASSLGFDPAISYRMGMDHASCSPTRSFLLPRRCPPCRS